MHRLVNGDVYGSRILIATPTSLSHVRATIGDNPASFPYLHARARVVSRMNGTDIRMFIMAGLYARGLHIGLRTLFFFPFPLFYSLIPKMIPYYSCIILFFASLHIIIFFLHMSETVGERRRSKRDEHDERSDSLDVAVAEVDEATLPSLPLLLPLASPSIDYCRVRVIVSTCVRHAQCVCARRTHGPAPFLQHFNPLFPNYSFL